MSETREYYSRSEEHGDVFIAEEVLAMLAGAAALEVDGVSGLAGATAAEQFLGRKKLSKGISILWESDNITIDVSIQIKYGVTIPEVAKKVQEAIISNVEATSGMQVSAVNVRVSGVTINNDSDIDALTDRIANQLGEKMIQDGRRWG